MKRYDAIVVGARCAGAATAMLLARHGLDVLVVDRATLPADVPRGHFVHRHGPARLARWGLLGRMLASGCPAVTTVTQDLGDGPLTGTDLRSGAVPLGIGPRRRILDQILLEAAAGAGAEVRDGYAVIDYAMDGGRMTGIRGRDVRSGAVGAERATVVVGADGRNTPQPRAVGAPLGFSAPTAACWYFSYFGGADLDGLHIHMHDGRAVFAFPTNDGLAGVFVGWPAAALASVRRDVEGSFARALAAVPALADWFADASREERWLGATQLPNFIRRPHGLGWALVGDAGCHKDPILALGICDALRDAELLADAIADGCSGRAEMAEALRDYERRRDAELVPEFHANLGAAQLGPPPPEALAARAAVRGDEQATREYFFARQRAITAPGRVPVAA